MSHSLHHRFISLTLGCLFVAAAQAATPAQLGSDYRRDARTSDPVFTPSAARGQRFFAHRFGVSATLPSCSTCHGANPRQEGRHAVTGKRIAPLSPLANSERFTDPKKVEKWFRRNCGEIVGRECSAAEKADFIEFLTQGA